MTREEAIEILKDLWRTKHSMYLEADIRKALDMAIQTLEQDAILDKINEIIVDALDKSTDQKESQTLRWVLDKISEVT
jgi:hypothetical protein